MSDYRCPACILRLRVLKCVTANRWLLYCTTRMTKHINKYSAPPPYPPLPHQSSPSIKTKAAFYLLQTG